MNQSSPPSSEQPALPCYTVRAIKATGLLEETRSLLRAWQPGERATDLRRRVREQALLGKATANRSDDVVAHAFNQRFLAGPRPAAVLLQRLLELAGSGRWFTDLCLLYVARVDVVLLATISVYAAERRTTGRAYLDTPSLVQFLAEQQTQGRMVRPWLPTVRLRVAQHILHQLTDFGLVGQPRRSVRELLPFEPADLSVGWLAYDLHSVELPDYRVLAHEDWTVPVHRPH